MGSEFGTAKKGLVLYTWGNASGIDEKVWLY